MAKKVSRQELAERTGAVILVALYLRVSRLGDRILDSEEFRSPRLQVEAISRELDRRYPEGWAPVPIKGNYDTGIWADFDVSGTSDERVGLDAAIDAVEAHGALALGVLNISRWARGVELGLRRIEDLESRGAELVSAQEQLDAVSPTGRFSLTLYLAIAQLYADQKGEEWSSIIEQRSDSGLHHGRVPVGYDRGDDGILTVDPTALPVLVEAFESYAAGASKTTVGRLLRDAGLVSATSQATPILGNRVYRRGHAPACAGTGCARPDAHGDRGEVRQWELAPASPPKPGSKKKRRPREKTRVGELWVPGQHAGIIDADLFDRVAARLEQTATTGERQREPRHPLVGVVRCAECGRALACDYGGTRITMKCSSGRAIGCAGPGVVTADRILEDVVWPNIDALHRRVGRARQRAARAGSAGKSSERRSRQPDRDRLTDAHQGLLDRIAEVEADKAEGIHPGGDAAADATLARLRQRAEVALTKLAAAAPPVRHGPEPADQLALVVDGWEAWDVKARNAALRSLLTVYVGRRGEDAPFRQPYAERCTVRWAWMA